MEDGSEKLLTDEGVTWVMWDSDSRRLFYTKTLDSGSHLYSFSLDTAEETVLVEDMQDLELFSVSPDGKHWAFEKHGGQDARILVLENFLPESTEASASR